MSVRVNERQTNSVLPNKSLRRDSTKFPGWSKLIRKMSRPSLLERLQGKNTSYLWDLVSEFYETKNGNLFITSNFQYRSYISKTYEMYDGTKRTEKIIDNPGTSLIVKRTFWHKTISLMIQSEYICPQCGSKRAAKAKCCPTPKRIEDINLI